MFKTIILKSPLATKEINISKQKDGLYNVNIIAYGHWSTIQFFNLKDCFVYIRQQFNLKKGINNGSKM